MVADDTNASVTVFDADTHAVLGTVVIDPGDPYETETCGGSRKTWLLLKLAQVAATGVL
jgi:hypothetical protein